MTEDEIVDLLTLIAAYDQRTVGRADVQAWHMIAVEARWSWPLARRAVIDFHVSGGDKPRIKPAHITDTIRDLRRSMGRALFTKDITPPKELADNPAAEIEWRRNFTRRAIDDALHAWAEGREVPTVEPEEPARIAPVDPRIRSLANAKGIPADIAEETE